MDAPAALCPDIASASQDRCRIDPAAEWWLPSAGRGAVVPYIAAWSGEEALTTQVVGRGRSGIGFADETLTDRDENDVLWTRIPSRPGVGRPLYGQVHSL